MGKLHKIRKAVEKNPNAFIYSRSNQVWGVKFWNSSKEGIVYDGIPRPDWGGSHKNYVRKVLKDLGYLVR